MAWDVTWKVEIDGEDITSAMDPYLLSISITDKAGGASDTCSLKLDDEGGQIRLPRKGAGLRVVLQGVEKFVGTVDKAPWSFTRGGGRQLSVNAKGFDARGKVKEGQAWHMDDASLEDALKKSGEKAGISVKVDPAFAAIERDYWSPDGRSFMGWAQALADEFHATFKIRGDQAVFAQRGTGKSPNGQDLPTIFATVGVNVISIPNADALESRRVFSESEARYFDRASATFKTVTKGFEAGDSQPPATNRLRAPAADEAQANELIDGRKTEAEREGGGATINLDLEVEAQPEATLVLTGARPGIDGDYRIDSVTHKANRSGGSTTSCTVKQPHGTAGKDDR